MWILNFFPSDSIYNPSERTMMGITIPATSEEPVANAVSADIGNEKIVFSNFASTARESSYSRSSETHLIGDSYNNGILDSQMELAGLHSMNASDFLL